ncbi:sensor histidine kinase [Brevibacillus fluminis]|uniref:histidine kinase n=1 Tax=Brevibacillus fluminis TaxID=511487 RepID=A0A3M8CRY6_9BACL|nr:sensor histidine kinase [Brevibacillus fluminis]RNB78540.1 sensor histidine kinase [Brevibacillus fluminis]
MHVRKLLPIQIIVVLFCLAVVSCFLVSVPRYYERLVAECILSACKVTPAPPMPLAVLQQEHLTVEGYAMTFTVIDASFTLLFYLAALIILWKCFREPLGLLASLMLVSFGTTFPSLVWAAAELTPALWHWYDLVDMIGWITLISFFLIFPDGRFVPAWTVKVLLLICLVYLYSGLFPGAPFRFTSWPNLAKAFWLLSIILLLVSTQIYRYRKKSLPLQRQQTKWIVFGMSCGLGGFISISFLFEPALFQWGATAYIYLNGILELFLLIIPLTLTLAIVRLRLWDIDPLVKRTLVYIGLSVFVVAVYILSVLYLSRLFQTKDNVVISLLATSVVAVLFAPLKERLQRLVNRMMKGRHDDPYAVLAELGNQLVKPISPEAMLEVVVTTIKESLRLPYTGISISVNGQNTLVASAGERTDELLPFPIIHRGEELGTLLVANRSLGETFTAADYKLLDVLLTQSGPIIQNVNMTIGMKLLADALQESREKLVLAREEERRQIRHNLHDDLAPRLAALALNAAAAEKHVVHNPETAKELMVELRKVIRSTVDEIRTLVHDLRPPTLDELGLIGAVQERINELGQSTRHLTAAGMLAGMEFSLHAPDHLPPLPAAVEVAAYRIITELVVNVVRHANATACTVQIKITPSHQLVLEVTDNGVGIQPRPKPSEKGGLGLVSIRERAAELGGHCVFERLETGGTQVTTTLPL